MAEKTGLGILRARFAADKTTPEVLPPEKSGMGFLMSKFAPSREQVEAMLAEMGLDPSEIQKRFADIVENAGAGVVAEIKSLDAKLDRILAAIEGQDKLIAGIENYLMQDDKRPYISPRYDGLFDVHTEGSAE